MNEKYWKNKTWILDTKYPPRTKLYIGFIVLLCIILIGIIFIYHYPIYKTFYGYVEENGKYSVKVIVPMNEIEDFERALKENKKIDLLKVENEIDIVSGQHVVYASVYVAIDEKLLVKNNIVPIKLKVKEFSLWQEFSKKWKEGMKK